MDIAHIVPSGGLVFAGQPHHDSDDYEQMLAAAKDWLRREQGMSSREATHLTTWTPTLMVPAYIADHNQWGMHFVQEHHDGAQPVTVVHVPTPPDPEREAA